MGGGAPGVSNLLKDGFKHFSGLEEAILKNVEACKQLAQITRTSLGPNGTCGCQCTSFAKESRRYLLRTALGRRQCIEEHHLTNIPTLYIYFQFWLCLPHLTVSPSPALHGVTSTRYCLLRHEQACDQPLGSHVRDKRCKHVIKGAGG